MKVKDSSKLERICGENGIAINKEEENSTNEKNLASNMPELQCFLYKSEKLEVKESRNNKKMLMML